MRFYAVTGALALMLAASCGCQRVKQEKTIEVAPGDVVAPFIVDAPSADQEVTVKIKAEKGAPVDVYVVLEKERPAASEDITNNRAPKNALAGQRGVEDAALTARVPAKNEYAV